MYQHRRIQKALTFLKSLPYKKRKYEKCSALEHSLRIAHKMNTKGEVIVALFHDVLEDFEDIASKNLKKFCTQKEIRDIELLTKNKQEHYFEYLQRVATSTRARKVKIYDILDNLKTAHLKNKQKYIEGIEFLVSKR